MPDQLSFAGDPVVVARFASRVEAELARSLLAEHGIDARVIADDAGGLHPELSIVTGGVGLLVTAQDAELSRVLLHDDTGVHEDESRPLARRRRRAAWVVAIAVVVVLVTLADAVRQGGLVQL